MYPQKGVLQNGSDADIVLWNPDTTISYGVKEAKHRTDYNLYEEWQLKGYPVRVISRGKTIVNNHEWFGNKGWGKFIHRQPFSLTWQ
jgi:dihydropyrimidinase